MFTPKIFFSPNGGCEQEIVSLLAKANYSVLMQAYTFTSKPICDMLVSKGKRVRFIGDADGMKGPGCLIKNLFDAGIECWIDSAHHIAHNKIIIIDKIIVITGSFNFSESAEHKNAENLVILQNRNMASVYTNNWIAHQSHSKPYLPLTTAPTNEVNALAKEMYAMTKIDSQDSWESAHSNEFYLELAKEILQKYTIQPKDKELS